MEVQDLMETVDSEWKSIQNLLSKRVSGMVKMNLFLLFNGSIFCRKITINLDQLMTTTDQ